MKVNDGWKLVPVAPTMEMRVAGSDVHDQRPSEAEAIYRAMLTAAPAPAVDSGAAAEGEAVAWRFKHKHDGDGRWRFNDKPSEGEPWTVGEPLFAHLPAAEARIAGQSWAQFAKEQADRALAAEARLETMARALEPFARAAPPRVIPDNHAMLFEGLGENCKPVLLAKHFRAAAKALLPVNGEG